MIDLENVSKFIPPADEAEKKMAGFCVSPHSSRLLVAFLQPAGQNFGPGYNIVDISSYRYQDN